MQPAFRNTPKVPPEFGKSRSTQRGLTKTDIPMVKEKALDILTRYAIKHSDKEDLYFTISLVETELENELGIWRYGQSHNIIKPALDELVEEGRLKKVKIFVKGSYREFSRSAYRPV